jgi:hypothetical protein
MNGRNILGRLLKLEQGSPNEHDQAQMRARIERARSRILADMTDDERDEYQARREAVSGRMATLMDDARRRGRKPSLAEMLVAAR